MRAKACNRLEYVCARAAASVERDVANAAMRKEAPYTSSIPGIQESIDKNEVEAANSALDEAQSRVLASGPYEAPGLEGSDCYRRN